MNSSAAWRSGLTPITYGAAPLGNLYREVTDAAAHATLEQAWAGGVRSFDTAPHYGLGLSERRLGEFLSTRAREEFVISTKVGRLLVETPNPDGALDSQGFVVPADRRRVWDFSRDGVMRSLESSLERLGLDRIDIVLIHDPDDHWDEASGQAVPALVELRDQGVIGAVGVGMNQAEMLTRFVTECDVDVVMCAGRWSLLDRRAGERLLPAAIRNDVAVLAAGVFNSGMLARHEVPDNATYDYEQAPAALIARARSLAALCDEHGTTLPAAALHFALRTEGVTSVALGMARAEHAKANADLLAAAPPESFWDALDDWSARAR